MRKILVAIGLALVFAAPVKACPPGMFNTFAVNSFAICPRVSFEAVDIATVQLVPQVFVQRQFVPRVSFETFAFNPCGFQQIQPFAMNQFANTNAYGIGASNFGFNNGFSFNNGFNNAFNFSNGFNRFGGFNGSSNRSFIGRNFEFNAGDPRRLSIRENPRGGVRIRERGR
jgi:hypothetical protein